jgi:hypothetical protein
LPTPVIFIATYANKDGELEGFRQFLRELIELLRTNDQSSRSVDAFIADDGRQAAIVLVGADPDSIRNYWRVLHQHTGRSLQQLAEPIGVQIYGPAGDITPERRHGAGAVGTLTLMPERVDGFTRLEAGR